MLLCPQSNPSSSSSELELSRAHAGRSRSARNLVSVPVVPMRSTPFLRSIQHSCLRNMSRPRSMSMGCSSRMEREVVRKSLSMATCVEKMIYREKKKKHKKPKQTKKKPCFWSSCVETSVLGIQVTPKDWCVNLVRMVTGIALILSQVKPTVHISLQKISQSMSFMKSRSILKNLLYLIERRL